jgi:hypothetical protein
MSTDNTTSSIKKEEIPEDLGVNSTPRSRIIRSPPFLSSSLDKIKVEEKTTFVSAIR